MAFANSILAFLLVTSCATILCQAPSVCESLKEQENAKREEMRIGLIQINSCNKITMYISVFVKKVFKGIAVQIRKRGTATIQEGSFTVFDDDRYETFSCSGGTDNTLIHIDDTPTNQTGFLWKGPPTKEAIDIVFMLDIKTGTWRVHEVPVQPCIAHRED